MKRFFENLSNFNKSVLLSVAVHILFLLLFLILRSGLDLPDTEFAEIGFVSTTTSQPYRTTPRQPAETRQEPEPQQSQPAAPQQQVTPEEEAKAPPVNLPKRRMLEDEEPDLTRRQSGKLTPSQESRPEQDDSYDTEQMQKELAERATTGKEFQQPGGSEFDGRDSQAPASDVGSNKQMPYTIEGDASKRRILTQVLPEYPPGLQREAVVKIRFFVRPDGRIGTMIPVQKGDPQLEAVTMKAMRQWRFNALPSDEEQRNVEGVITFVYKLR